MTQGFVHRCSFCGYPVSTHVIRQGFYEYLHPKCHRALGEVEAFKEQLREKIIKEIK